MIRMTFCSTLQREEFIDNVYTKPWCRMSAFLIGMIYGYITYLKGTNLKMTPVGCFLITFKNLPWLENMIISFIFTFIKAIVATGWTMTMGIILYLTFGTFIHSSQEQRMSHGMFIYYGTMTRPAWAMAVGWIILACSSGYGGRYTHTLKERWHLCFHQTKHATGNYIFPFLRLCQQHPIIQSFHPI